MRWEASLLLPCIYARNFVVYTNDNPLCALQNVLKYVLSHGFMGSDIAL